MRTSLVIGLLLLSLAAGAHADPKHDLQKLLDATISLKPFQDLPDLTLKDALDLFHESVRPLGLKDVAFFVDTTALRISRDSADVMEARLKFPKYPAEMKFKHALELVLWQLEDHDPVLLVRPKWLEITSREKATLRYQTVQGTYDKAPLGDVLDDFAHQTGLSINLKDAKKRKLPITARFLSATKLSDALRLVADMASMKVHTVDHLVYLSDGPNPGLEDATSAELAPGPMVGTIFALPRDAIELRAKGQGGNVKRILTDKQTQYFDTENPSADRAALKEGQAVEVWTVPSMEWSKPTPLARLVVVKGTPR